MSVNQTHIERIVTLAKAYGAKRLILFGSALSTPDVARDVDLACDGIPGWKLYEFAVKLEEELHTTLDIVPLSPSTRFTRLIETRGKVLL